MSLNQKDIDCQTGQNKGNSLIEMVDDIIDRIFDLLFHGDRLSLTIFPEEYLTFQNFWHYPEF